MIIGQCVSIIIMVVMIITDRLDYLVANRRPADQPSDRRPCHDTSKWRRRTSKLRRLKQQQQGIITATGRRVQDSGRRWLAMAVVVDYTLQIGIQYIMIDVKHGRPRSNAIHFGQSGQASQSASERASNRAGIILATFA